MARVCPPDLASQRDDLVQSAVLRVLEIERKGEATAPLPASYLWRVAFSVIADEMRRRRRSLLVPASATGEGEPPDRNSPAPQPELARAIEACLERLVEARRLAVLLWLQGFQTPDATRVLRWPPKRVRNATFRGLSDLRACLRAKGVAP